MSHIKRKSVAWLLSFFVVLAFAAPVSLADTSAQDSNAHWSEAAIAKCFQFGILKGFNGDFRPDDSITRAEFAAMVNRSFGFPNASGTFPFSDVRDTAWYAQDLNTAAAAGYLTGVAPGVMAPEKTLSRQEAFVMLARIYHLEPDSASSSTLFDDDAQIAPWARPAISALSSAGYVQGSEGQIAPLADITRGEAAQLLCNLLGEVVDQDFSAESCGNLTIRSAGVTVSDTVVNGDLCIAAGVGEGEVTLDNVTVKGRLLAAGGGENSLYFVNCDIRELVVTKTQVRIVLQNNTVVSFALALTGDSTFELAGNTKVETLTLIGEGVTVKTTGTSSIGTLNADAAGTRVEMSAGTVIGTLNRNGETTVTGSGTIDTLTGSNGQTGSSSAGSGGGSSGGSGGSAVVFSSHNVPNKPNTPFGTIFSELSLPSEVILRASNNTTCSALISWDSAAYRPQLSGVQTIAGDIAGDALPSWAPASISIRVTVLPQPIPTSLVIKGESLESTPVSMTPGETKRFTAEVRDQFHLVMQSQTISWSIVPAVTGVSVSAIGAVSVESSCTATSFNLSASCGAAQDTHTVSIQIAPAVTAPQVTDLAIAPDADPPMVYWKTPASLPYPVKYEMRIITSEGETVGYPTQSFEQATTQTGKEWYWPLLNELAPYTGSYRLQVTTLAVHDETLSSAPLVYDKTIEITALEAPFFEAVNFLGMQGDMLAFEAVLPEGVPLLTMSDKYFVDLNFGNGWKTNTSAFVLSDTSDRIHFSIPAEANPLGEIVLENCRADILHYSDFRIEDNAVYLSLSPAQTKSITQGPPMP